MCLCKELVDVLMCCTYCFLDVTVGLSILFTDENYNAAYEDVSSFATEILRDKIKENVSEGFALKTFYHYELRQTVSQKITLQKNTLVFFYFIDFFSKRIFNYKYIN